MKNFILLSSERAGSSFLVELLNKHPNIKSYGELFNIDSLPTKQELDKALNNPIAYLQEKLSCSRFSDDMVIGFKMFYTHAQKDQLIPDFKPFDKMADGMKKKFIRFRDCLESEGYNLEEIGCKFEELWQYFKDEKNFYIIHLKRKNLLRQYLSFQTAFETNEWRRTKDKVIKNKVHEITIKYDKFAEYIELQKNNMQKYDECFKDHNMVNIFYEDLDKNTLSKVNNILNFLSLPLFEKIQDVQIIKQGNTSLPERISNYSELKKEFANTSSIKFFEE